jgi:succinoglycan biosynthesis protein ExoA
MNKAIAKIWSAGFAPCRQRMGGASMSEHRSVPPSTLIIIPCLNEEAHLDRILRQIGTILAFPNARLVIVDGGSSDRTPDQARFLAAAHSNILFLENPKRIQSAAINLAVATYGAEAEYLIRIDAHADYPEHYCETLLAEAKKTGADSVVVSMRTIGKAGFQSAVAAAQNSKLGNGGSAHRAAGEAGRWIDHGHHALMRLAAFRDVGGYDENFAANEDAELDMRLRQKNFKIWLTGKTFLTYYPRATPAALFRQYFRYGYGRAKTILKHRVRPKIRQLLPVFVAPAALLAFAAPVFALSALPFVAWFWLCGFYGFWIAFKARKLSLAMAGAAAMIMHFAWSLGFWKAILTRRGKGR